VCAGNPTWCDGARFYDALQCSGGVWVTTAATVCADAGYPDVVSYDAEGSDTSPDAPLGRDYDAGSYDAGVSD